MACKALELLRMWPSLESHAEASALKRDVVVVVDMVDSGVCDGPGLDLEMASREWGSGYWFSARSAQVAPEKG